MQYSFCITFYLLPGQCIYIPACSQTFNFDMTSLLPKDMRESALLLLILPKGPDRRAKIFIRTADSHILPIWNVSNVLFSCWDFLPSIQAVGLFWLGITTESTWFTCTPVVSKSAMGRQQFQTIYIYIFIERCIWLFNAFLVEIDQGHHQMSRAISH